IDPRSLIPGVPGPPERRRISAAPPLRGILDVREAQMHSLNLRRDDRESLLLSLQEMPAWLGRTFEPLSAGEAVRRSADGRFAPVEQCWHLADLEREAFAERLRRLREEDRPVLGDWDGERAAIERAYLRRNCADCLAD